MHVNITVSSPKLTDKRTKLLRFREQVKEKVETGQHFRLDLWDVHRCLQKKELIENALNKSAAAYLQSKDPALAQNSAAVSPLAGHEITKEYRTKMTDWMVEVCTSFKCAKRTYFLAVQMFDKYLLRAREQGQVLTNKDVHCLGVTAMYLASKYEDIFPLHSKIVSEKIAHKAIPAKDILTKEGAYLNLFNFELDFVTHFDFYETYADKFAGSLIGHERSGKAHQGASEADKKHVKLATDMALILTKMAMQNVDFSSHSPSVVVASSFLAAVNMLSASKKLAGDEVDKFCKRARHHLECIIEEEHSHLNKLMKESDVSCRLQRKTGSQQAVSALRDLYASQFKTDSLNEIAQKLIDFFKIFDDWHCGLN